MITKICTDLEQSKKLAEILPLESADMRYHTISQYNIYPCDEIVYTIDFGKPSDIDIPCWSLAALIGLMPRIEHMKPFIDLSPKLDSEEVAIYYHSEDSPYIVKDNLIDACYELIVKLHEQKLL